MKYLVLALPFLALPCAAFAEDEPLPTAMSLAGGPCVPPQQEEERMRAGQGGRPVMEYVYEYSELEAGMTWTDWGSRLRLDPHAGGYVRWGVGLTPNLSLNLAFRYAEGGNTEVAAGENVMERALLAGVGLRVPITGEFAATGNAAVGFMRFDSGAANVASNTAPAFAVEGALTVRLWEVLRLKAGVGLDLLHSDFHRTSADWSLSVTYLVGFELGM